MNEMLQFLPLGAGVLSMLFVVYLVLDVLKQPRGNELMAKISDQVQEGAKAFLKREYTYISAFVIVIASLIAVAPMLKKDLELGWQTSVCFILGALGSAIAGYIGMSIATRANSRTTEAARTGGTKGALGVAISGGAVMGMSVVGVALIGLTAVYLIFKKPVYINGYAMGASLVALFMRSGGGIYTKGADMGADLVGKVEAGIPEDDPRNPAVIADNVGDNVGDVAGLGSDLMESYVESMIAAMAIASTLHLSGALSDKMSLMPLIIAAVGIIASIVGVLWVKIMGKSSPQSALMGGTYVAAGITILASFLIINKMGEDFVVDGTTYKKLGVFWSLLAGILSGVGIGFVSEYYTSSKFKPVKQLAENSQSGPAICITDGLAWGMKSCTVPAIFMVIAIMVSYGAAGFYGIAMAAFGMLATTGIIVSVDSYGPIADNAGGVAEMAKLPPEVRNITDNLDAVGNTTAAIGKGFAIGSAAFAAVGLLAAYMIAAKIDAHEMTLSDPKILCGLLLGGMFPYFFSSLLFKAVTNAAYKMIEEVRRQFKDDPKILKGEADPDTTRCVDIATKGAIQGMLIPGGLAIILPVCVGLYSKEMLAGVLVGTIVSGVMLGIMFANAGGAYDNAKKYIEEGHFGGKGSDTHKATVVGDTVGDPMKDTVGPSINILLKLMAVISLVLAPLFN